MHEDSLTDAAEQRFPTFSGIGGRKRRRGVVVRLVAMIDEELTSGNEFTSEEQLIDRVVTRAREDQEFGISPILVIILGELVAWLVRRILDRFFPKEGEHNGRDAAQPSG